VPAVICAFPAVTSAMSLIVTFAPRAAADAVNEGSSACDPPLKPTRTGLVLPATSDAATIPTTTRTAITVVPANEDARAQTHADLAASDEDDGWQAACS